MADKTPPPNDQGPTGGFHVDAAPSDADPAVFEVLADRRRRYVLFALMETEDGIADVVELADQVHRWERAADEDAPPDHRDRVIASLYHADVPRLADAGLLEFDARSKTVRYRGGEEYEAVLELVASMDPG